MLCGKNASAVLLQNVAFTVEKLNRKPAFAIIQIGDNAASNIYISRKIKVAKIVDISAFCYKFSSDVAFEIVAQKIQVLNHDKNIDGIIIQLPLEEKFHSLIYLIDPKKDIDGLGVQQQGNLALNLPGLRPCTPMGVIKLLKHYNIPISGQDICVVGRSVLVGQSLALMLLHEGASVSIVHSKTKNLSKYIQNVNILISAVGKAGFINADMVGQSVFVDIGINNLDGKIIGDFDHSVYKKAIAYTPVPGGVGPMTVACLMQNVLLAYQLTNVIP